MGWQLRGSPLTAKLQEPKAPVPDLDASGGRGAGGPLSACPACMKGRRREKSGSRQATPSVPWLSVSPHLRPEGQEIQDLGKGHAWVAGLVPETRGKP